MSARETANRMVAAAHVAADGSVFTQYGFGSIVKTGEGTYEFTADGIQKEAFVFGEDVVHVTARALFNVNVVELQLPGGVLEVQILAADGKAFDDGEFDIVILNAPGAF